MDLGNDFQQVLDSSDGSLHAGPHWSAPSNFCSKFSFLNKFRNFSCFRFQSRCSILPLFPIRHTCRQTSPICGKYHESKPRSQSTRFFDLITLCGHLHPPFCAGGKMLFATGSSTQQQNRSPPPLVLHFPSYGRGRIPCSKSTSLIASGMPRKFPQYRLISTKLLILLLMYYSVT